MSGGAVNRAASPTSDISPKTQAPLSISGAGAKFADPPRPGSAEETLKTPVAEGNGKQPAAGYFPAVEPGRAANGGTTSSTDKAKSPASPSDDDIDPLDTSRIKTDAAPSTAPQRPQVFVVNRTPDGQPSDVRRVQSAGDAEGKVAAGKDGLGGPVEPPASRRASVTSLSFRLPSAPGLPQGHPRLSNAARIRSSSPPPEAKFVYHVAFDNIDLDNTKSNVTSLTLNVKHKGYKHQRTSRTFMIGIDEHAYSDYALEWLLDELIDDGDELVCVRVVEKEIRSNDKSYRAEAQQLIETVQQRSRDRGDKAISIVVEYACGKLHNTFQHFIQVYQPSMLVVGTKGRPLDGVQGLFSTRNSFSKYCLQYSPVPVVVVRPTEKRIKKKSKRANDPNRHSYAAMLAYNGGVHEADSDSGGVYELEARLSPDEEAHRVAAALGLPASFDPTIKKADIAALLSQRHHPPSPSMLSAQMAAATGITPTEVATAPKNESPAVGGPGAKDLSVGPESTVASSAGGEDSDGASGGDSSDDDDDSPEFETISGKSALEQDRKLDRLHDMERGEARALLKQARKGSVDSGAVDDEEDDD